MTDQREATYAELGRAFAAVLRLEIADALPASEPIGTVEAARLLTLHEVAERIGLKLSSVKALVGKELPPLYQGRTVRVASDDVDAYIARLRRQSGQRFQGEPSEPIDLGKSRRQRAASSVAGRGRTAKTKRTAVSGN